VVLPVPAGGEAARAHPRRQAAQERPVTSWLQRQTAERAAYDAPGVTMVDNKILVEPPDGDNCEIC
jgi:hypothetical protein